MTDRPDNVPANLAPYVDALGIDMAVTLFLAMGGAVQYFGLRPRADGRLAQTVGLEAAQRLGAAIGPGTERIPLANAFCARHLRYQRGLTVKEIARMMHTSDVTVRRYAPEPGKAGDQADLFSNT